PKGKEAAGPERGIGSGGVATVALGRHGSMIAAAVRVVNDDEPRSGQPRRRQSASCVHGDPGAGARFRGNRIGERCGIDTRCEGHLRAPPDVDDVGGPDSNPRSEALEHEGGHFIGEGELDVERIAVQAVELVRTTGARFNAVVSPRTSVVTS
ncbi:MAG: hypothetical protein QOJ69_657, partial [Actinomycetota bacterium]|nr:hypothetical protein [Actinomycetota bacterium]